MFIIKYKNFFLSLAVGMILVSICSAIIYKPKLGIDFTGGSRSTLVYEGKVPASIELITAIEQAGLGTPIVQSLETGVYSVKLKSLTESERITYKNAVSLDGAYHPTESSFTLVGPSVGVELQKKAYIAIFLVILAIVLFISFSFRSVSKPVASWKYGLIAIVTLAHDIIIPTGVYAYLGHTKGVEIDVLFVIALLTILGVSVSDTIVIFDRIRENLKKNTSKIFSEVVGKSLSQSFVRSINTSLTVILVLSALVMFGPASTKYFAITLLVGVAVGTYSSIFVASPILTLVEKYQKK